MPCFCPCNPPGWTPRIWVDWGARGEGKGSALTEKWVVVLASGKKQAKRKLLCVFLERKAALPWFCCKIGRDTVRFHQLILIDKTAAENTFQRFLQVWKLKISGHHHLRRILQIFGVPWEDIPTINTLTSSSARSAFQQQFSTENYGDKIFCSPLSAVSVEGWASCAHLCTIPGLCPSQLHFKQRNFSLTWLFWDVFRDDSHDPALNLPSSRCTRPWAHLEKKKKPTTHNVKFK